MNTKIARDRQPHSKAPSGVARIVASLICMVAAGCAPSRQQEILHPQPIPENAAAPQDCPDFSGHFMFPAGNPITIQQTGCTEIVETIPDGQTVIHLMLDGSPQAVQGAGGRRMIRRSIWNGSTVQTEEKVYLQNGDWTARGIVMMALNPHGDIVLHRETATNVDGKEAAGPPKADHVAERLSNDGP